MPFIHGKNSAVLMGAVDLSPFFNDATIAHSVDTAEVSAFGDNSKAYIAGMRDGTVSLTGMFDGDAGASDVTLSTAFGSDTLDPTSVMPGRRTAGARAYLIHAHTGSYEVTSPVSDVVAASADLQAEAGIEAGVVLAFGTAATAAGNGDAVDGDASTSNGLVAHLHVTANSRDGASTVKVQHSADNVSWADLLTFASVTAATTAVERAAATGTVNRYLRAAWTPGGSTGTITLTVTLARR